MRQKMAIARSIVHHPTLLFLDEPTAGLDPEAAKLVRDFIETLRSEGVSIFLTTHNLDEADRLCDRVAVFKTRLIREDTPANLRAQLYGQRVEVQLTQPLTEPQSAALQTLSFIKDVQPVADGKYPTISIGLSDPAAQNPDLVRKLVEIGAAVQYVTPL
jgi:ABC-2 type transport system ATP-binding protein